MCRCLPWLQGEGSNTLNAAAAVCCVLANAHDHEGVTVYLPLRFLLIACYYYLRPAWPVAVLTQLYCRLRNLVAGTLAAKAGCFIAWQQACISSVVFDDADVDCTRLHCCCPVGHWTTVACPRHIAGVALCSSLRPCLGASLSLLSLTGTNLSDRD
jgi:hypothetical protein